MERPCSVVEAAMDKLLAPKECNSLSFFWGGRGTAGRRLVSRVSRKGATAEAGLRRDVAGEPAPAQPVRRNRTSTNEGSEGSASSALGACAEHCLAEGSPSATCEWCPWRQLVSSEADPQPEPWADPSRRPPYAAARVRTGRSQSEGEVTFHVLLGGRHIASFAGLH